MSAPTLETSSFETAQGLRLLLTRLHYAGPHAWESDPEANELMLHTMRKYAALAHRHGLEQTEAAAAAFEAMRTRAVRVALDPWAVVTRAVQLSMVYQERAEGMLCSEHQARRPSMGGFHDAERFSDRETELANYHPALQVDGGYENVEKPADPQDGGDDGRNLQDEPTNAYVALDATVTLFVELGWPEHTARIGLEYIVARLIRTGTRLGAFEALRRDRHAHALLDMDHDAWLTMLRTVLGQQHPDRAHTSAGRGIFLRLLIGQHLSELFADSELADAIEAAAPRVSAGQDDRDRHV